MAIGAIWADIWDEAIWDTTIWSQVAVEPEPEEIVGGHFAQPDFREQRDKKRRKEARELRELIEKAAGLIEEAEEAITEVPAGKTVADVTPRPAFVSQVADLRAELDEIKSHIAPRRQAPIDLEASRRQVRKIIARTTDDLIAQIADVLIEVIQEIIEDG